jgi:hypothetical protein
LFAGQSGVASATYIATSTPPLPGNVYGGWTGKMAVRRWTNG